MYTESAFSFSTLFVLLSLLLLLEVTPYILQDYKNIKTFLIYLIKWNLYKVCNNSVIISIFKSTWFTMTEHCAMYTDQFPL